MHAKFWDLLRIKERHKARSRTRHADATWRGNPHPHVDADWAYRTLRLARSLIRVGALLWAGGGCGGTTRPARPPPACPYRSAAPEGQATHIAQPRRGEAARNRAPKPRAACAHARGGGAPVHALLCIFVVARRCGSCSTGAPLCLRPARLGMPFVRLAYGRVGRYIVHAVQFATLTVNPATQIAHSHYRENATACLFLCGQPASNAVYTYRACPTVIYLKTSFLKATHNATHNHHLRNSP